MYGTTPLRLVAPDVLEQLDARERAALIRCNAAFAPASQPDGTAAGHLGSLERVEIPDISGARRVRSANRTLEWERQVARATREALRFSATVGGSNVNPETLEQLRDEVTRLVRAYPTQPVPALLGDLVVVQELAFRLLEGRQRPDQTRELYLLAGVVCGLLANASHNLGDPHAAMAQARTAYVCADNAGHDGLRAWVRGQQSVVAYWGGSPHEALRYAQLGADPAARATGTTAVFLPALAGRAWAALGNGDESRAAVERAHTAREAVVPDELDGGLTFTRPRQLYYAADATGWLPGEEERAEREALEAVDAYERADPTERSYADEAVVSADLALARAHLGELDGARAALRPVLDLPSAQRLSGIAAVVQRVHVALRDPRYRGSSAVREAQEEIEAFSRVPAGASLLR